MVACPLDVGPPPVTLFLFHSVFEDEDVAPTGTHESPPRHRRTPAPRLERNVLRHAPSDLGWYLPIGGQGPGGYGRVPPKTYRQVPYYVRRSTPFATDLPR